MLTKKKIIYSIVGLVLGFTRVEGAFEEVKPLQNGQNIVALMEKPAYDQDEIKGYDLNEIFIAGALLMEGWGCDQDSDEKKALQLYRTALEVLRKDPMDLDVVLSEETLQGLFDFMRSQQAPYPIYKAEYDQCRRPNVLYAMIADTIRLLLRQGEYEEALQLMEESRRMSLFKGKMLEEEKREDVKDAEDRGLKQVVLFYEFTLNYELEDGYLSFIKTETEPYDSEPYGALMRNRLVGGLVVQGFEQKPVEEKLKAFPYVLRNAKLGVPQAIEAMHLYYKFGCGVLPSNQRKAKKWRDRYEAMIHSYSSPE